MKNITIALLFICSQFALSQPILNASDFPSTYSSTGVELNVTGFTNGPTGANVVWDYSTITFLPGQYIHTIVDVNTTPYVSIFPTANYCQKRESNVGSTYYYYYILTDQSLDLIGICSPTLITNYINDPMTIFPFPYTYPSQFDDTSWAVGSQFPPVPLQRVCDAYGTLIMPDATYTNVIRQRASGPMAGIAYEWIATNPYRVLMMANFDYGAIYFGGNTLNNNQQQIAKFQLYPNPTTEYFSVKVSLATEKLTVEVYDVLGKLILKNDDYTSESTISLKEFNKGIYIVKITNTNHTVLFTEKVIKE